MPSTIGQTLSKPSKQNGKQNDTATLQDTAYIYYHGHVLNSLTPQEQNFCSEAFESKKETPFKPQRISLTEASPFIGTFLQMF